MGELTHISEALADAMGEAMTEKRKRVERPESFYSNSHNVHAVCSEPRIVRLSADFDDDFLSASEALELARWLERGAEWIEDKD